MRYTELKQKHEKEFGDFPIVFAFSDNQLEEGLAKLGVTISEVVGIPGGGIIRKTDKSKLVELLAKHDKEREKAKEDDEFLSEAIRYELGNHEYCITYDPTDTIEALDLNIEDPRIKKLFRQAVNQYLEENNNEL